MKRRGFTMLEVLVVVAIVAIGAAVAMASFSRSTAKADLRAAANEMVGDLRRARSLAKTGTTPPGAFLAGERTVEAGIRIATPTTYQVFIDRDNQANGNEVAVEVVDIRTKFGPGFSITAPATPVEIRFRRNGTLDQPNNVSVVMAHPTGGGQRTITVTYGGTASFM